MTPDNLNAVTAEVVVLWRDGCCVRMVGLIARVGSMFNSEIELSCNGTTAGSGDALSLMALEANCGDRVRITARGAEAAETVAALCGLFGVQSAGDAQREDFDLLATCGAYVAAIWASRRRGGGNTAPGV